MTNKLPAGHIHQPPLSWRRSRTSRVPSTVPPQADGVFAGGAAQPFSRRAKILWRAWTTDRPGARSRTAATRAAPGPRPRRTRGPPCGEVPEQRERDVRRLRHLADADVLVAALQEPGTGAVRHRPGLGESGPACARDARSSRSCRGLQRRCSAVPKVYRVCPVSRCRSGPRRRHRLRDAPVGDGRIGRTAPRGGHVPRIAGHPHRRCLPAPDRRDHRRVAPGDGGAARREGCGRELGRVAGRWGGRVTGTPGRCAAATGRLRAWTRATCRRRGSWRTGDAGRMNSRSEPVGLWTAGSFVLWDGLRSPLAHRCPVRLSGPRWGVRGFELGVRLHTPVPDVPSRERRQSGGIRCVG